MTKISQLTDIGSGLAPNDEFIIRDVSDASTPNKKVTASGFFVVASALGITGFDNITAGLPATGTQTRVYASGISGRSDTTISGITVARTTISGYYENASGVSGGTLFPIVTQTDIGSAANQLSLNGMLGDMAFQSAAAINVDQASITQVNNIPLLAGGGLKFPPTQVASGDVNTLDDYEEGTWTPTAFTIGAQSPTVNSSTYTKVGNIAILHIQFGGSQTYAVNELVSITGIPFSVYGSGQLCGGNSGAGSSNVAAVLRVRNNGSASGTVIAAQGGINFGSVTLTLLGV